VTLSPRSGGLLGATTVVEQLDVPALAPRLRLATIAQRSRHEVRKAITDAHALGAALPSTLGQVVGVVGRVPPPLFGLSSPIRLMPAATLARTNINLAMPRSIRSLTSVGTSCGRTSTSELMGYARRSPQCPLPEVKRPHETDRHCIDDHHIASSAISAVRQQAIDS
jgi:hypothetical protein